MNLLRRADPPSAPANVSVDLSDTESMPPPAPRPRAEPGPLGSARDPSLELWATKHAPTSEATIVVAKKKLDVLREWFAGWDAPRRLSTTPRVLLVVGPPGSGKSAAIRLVAREFRRGVHEWRAPVPTLWEEHKHAHGGADWGTNASAAPAYSSKLDDFAAFVQRASRYAPLAVRSVARSSAPLPATASTTNRGLGETTDHERGTERDKQPVLLVEDLPVGGGEDQHRRALNLLARLARESRVPAVVAVSEEDAGGVGGLGSNPAGGGGGGGGGGCTARTASGAVPASNVEARRVEITGGTGPTPARSTAAADPSAGGSVPPEVESSLAPWPLHLASAEACAACVSARLEAAAAKSSTRELAEIHRAACAALRDPLDPEAVRLEAEPGPVGEGAETEKPEPSETSRHETSASFRAFPRRWLARWRAFAFAKGASDSRASRTWRPSLSSLREAVDELFCPHGGLAAPCELYRPAALSSANRAGAADDRTLALAALEAERTRGLRAVFGDDVRVSNAEAGTIRDATCDDAPRLREPRTGRRENGTRTRPSVFELELVPASAAAALEEVLGGRARPPRCFADVRSGGSREWTFEPGVCVSCAHRAADPTERSFGEEETLASAPAPPPIPAYFSQPVSVRRVRTSPAAFARAFADRAKAIAAIGAKRARLDEPSKRTDGGTEPPTAPERSTARRGRVVAAGGEKWWEAPRPGASAKGGGGGAAANLPRLDPVGRACSLVVDHDYTAWRVKLLALEKLAIHPLDISLFYVTYGRDDAADGDGATSTAPVAVFELENAETLREAGVPPGATLALFATAQRDPDDLTGLEMPMGPVAWESDAGGGEGRDGAVGGASARERGFAGTALAGSQ